MDDLVLGRPRRPLPGHPSYLEAGYVPYEERTPSLRVGGYAGEPAAIREQEALARLRREA